MVNKQTAFVAYPGRDRALASLIAEAVSHANAKPIPTRYEPWEFNDVPGNPLISPIVEGIDESGFIVADITYLNPNVIYEIGFAIGRRKRAFLIRHRATDGDKELAKVAGIFDTLGYHEYEDTEDLIRRLTSHIEPLPLPIDETLDRKAPVYVVEPASRGDAETMMVSRLKKARYRYRSFNPSEDSRLSAVDATRQVGASSGVLVCLQSESVTDSTTNNVRALFVAGLAHGLAKPTLILAPAGVKVPLERVRQVRSGAVKRGMERKPYPTDVTDAQWALIEPLIPAAKPGGRPRTVDMREVINGLFYLSRAGCAWRLLPHDFPPWSTVHEYYWRWRRDGTWERIHDTLRETVRVEVGREPEPSAAIIDSQTVKTTEKGGSGAMMSARR